MNKTAIVYWSGTGNTETMAQLIMSGANENGAETTMYTAGEFAGNLIHQFDVIAFGCPSMGQEQLEESEFEPMFSSCISQLKDKKIALFGSYGWGDGEWMRNWEELCKSNGAILVSESVICNDAPDSTAEEECKSLGKIIAQA